MQRPCSEGSRPASHSQNRPPLVTRSLQFSSGGQRGRHQDSDASQPRRPNTTPKPRIQRLLPSPSQSTAQDWNSSQQSMASPLSTLVRLPDSPPRSLSLHSMDASREMKLTRDDATSKNTASGLGFSSAEQGGEDVLAVRDTSVESNPAILKEASPTMQLFTDSNNEMDFNDANAEEVALEPEQNDKTDAHEQDEDKVLVSDIAGPLLADIGANQDDRQDVKDSVDENNDDDDDYKQALANRKQLLNDETNRQRIREELESYVGSLSSRTDANGEHLVEFPRNYQQIVSLMTQKDVNEEEKSQDGKNTLQSWSRVLIESGLSKQQAFGILEDVDDDPEGSSSLAAKIALKMARIRQLDTILEEKLGKNLYSNIVSRKQKRAQSPPQPQTAQEVINRNTTSSSSSRTFVTETQSTTLNSVLPNGGETSRSSTSNRQSNIVDDECLPGPKKSNNFIERNKQMVANGMKANMTKDEEDRLEKLLSDDPSDNSNDIASEEKAKPETADAPQECNEFAMNNDERKAIEDLIATKSGAYPLFDIDELQDGPTNEALLPSGESSRPVKSNIIQETKRERLQRQRLSRVEQELRFLHESPSVVIVGDDRDEDENDDCRSEISHATVASSTCSTHSGVISRHDFKCFLAQQKESFHSTPTASPDEIRQLLMSMGHGTSASSNVVAAATG